MAFRLASRWCLSLVVSVGIVGIVGCGGSVEIEPQDSGVPDDDTSPPATCTATTCGSLCIDIATDIHHCGGCDIDCGTGPGLTCVAGRCDATCSSPNTRCPASKTHKFPYCSDLFNDPANCGGCGFACSDRANATSTCTAARCGLKCDKGFADCDGSVATGCESKSDSDARNCGGCGKVCDEGASCASGTCTVGACAAPKTGCSGACVDTSTDPTNCGSCGNLCPGTACVGGACSTSPCASPSKVCGGVCVDVKSDPKNCGDCGIVCGPFDACSFGLCTGSPSCAPPRITCGTACVDPSFDPSNCGGCGKVCPAGSTCSGGTCSTSSTCTTAPGMALFYGATGSVEADWVKGAGLGVEIANEATWRAKSPLEFAKYRLIVIGEPDVGTPTSAMLQAAYDTRTAWGTMVTGRIAVLGMPAGTKARDGVTGAVILMKQTMFWLAHGPASTTALYVATDWGARNLDYLGTFGLFSESVASGDVATPVVPSHPMLSGSTDTSLSGWSLSVRAILTSYPGSFTSIVKGLGGPVGSTPPPVSGPAIVTRDVACTP
jgi:hypothetical protein